MRVFLIDPMPESRGLLLERVQEAVRRVQIKRLEILDGDFNLLREQAGGEPPALGILGPGCYEDLESAVERFKGFFTAVPICVVLENSIYASEALELRKFISGRILPIADIAQLAQAILDVIGASTTSGSSFGGTVGVIHVKGGVGASSLAASLAACWSTFDRQVSLIDLDDVSPLLSDWSRASLQKRRAVGELLLEGEVPRNRVDEVMAPVPGYQNLRVVPQPVLYGEGFHFKADVIEGAPSSAQYIPSLISGLEERNDLVVIDFGRSWGVSTFSALPLCKTVLFVFDEDKTSLKRSMETLRRFYRESDDPQEFDFNRWRFILNGATNSIIKTEQAEEFISRAELRPESFPVTEIKFSITGRDWYLSSEGEHPHTLFEFAEPKIQNQLLNLAHSIFPFPHRTVAEQPTKGGLREKLRNVVSFLS
jgi:cellulose biosynthesis protein BcsQ